MLQLGFEIAAIPDIIKLYRDIIERLFSRNKEANSPRQREVLEKEVPVEEDCFPLPALL